MNPDLAFFALASLYAFGAAVAAAALSAPAPFDRQRAVAPSDGRTKRRP